MTMRRWRASGEASRMNWCTTAVMRPGQRLKPLSESTSRYSTTANDAIRALAILRQPCSHKILADSRLPLEMGVSTVDRTRQSALDIGHMGLNRGRSCTMSHVEG